MTELNFMWFGIGVFAGSAYATIICTIGSETIYRFLIGCLKYNTKKINERS